MKGSRPEQAALIKNNDLSKTDDTRTVVSSVVDGLVDPFQGEGWEKFDES